MHHAFILGAGLGNRLRPLTNRLPKPLVPLFHQPLAARAMDACARVGIGSFAINTHHLPEAWEDFGSPFPGDVMPPLGANGIPAQLRYWQGKSLALFHEPVLLETGGGLKNIASWIGNAALLVHNGDIFSTLPLEKLIAEHAASGLPATLALRSHGGDKRVAINRTGSRVIDIRHELGVAAGTHVFTGIYCVNSGFTDLLPAGEKISIIEAFLHLAKTGRLGAVVLDEGVWLDLGDRDSYLRAHRELSLGPTIHPQAFIAPDALVERSVIGPGAIVESRAVVRDSVVWPGGKVSCGALLDRCIVFSNQPATGIHQDADL